MYINDEFEPILFMSIEDPTGDPAGDPPAADPAADPDPASDPTGDPPAATTAFPDDWRSTMAGGDEKLAAQLERFTTPADVGKSFFEARSKISAGDLLKPLPEDPSDEDVKAYREQQGLPAESKDYLENLGDGLVIGENDQEVFGSFADAMHAENMTQGQFNKAASWYNGLLDQQQAQIQELDATDKTSFEDTMREEWGSDYRANLNVIGALLDKGLPEELVENFKNARLSSGTAFFNDPGMMRWLVALGRESNPLSTMLPSGTDNAKGLEDRIGEIEKFMRSNRTEYNGNQKMQDEYLGLLEMRIKHQERNAA